MLQWQGHDISRAVGRVREPVSGESFSGIQERSQSLLREAVQNSLDARASTARPVRIRIHVASGAASLNAAAAATWFGEAWPHIQADPKLRDFDPTAPCPYLTIEDFNTKGLQGDLRERAPGEDTKNSWCLFFRKEGQSAKSDSERGRWGVGKVVFPLCSAAHTFIAATVRADDGKRLVMGQAMLRSRSLRGTQFLPDLWLCEPLGPEQLELPSSAPELFADFKRTFGLQRSDEPGLSVVVPYLDESIDCDSMLIAAIKEFFYPILEGSLIIEVGAPGRPPALLDQHSLPKHAEQLRGGSDDATFQIVELARWYLERSDPPLVVAPPAGRGGLDWDDAQLSPDQIAHLRGDLGKGEPIHLLMRMPVIPKRGAELQGAFDLVLRHTPDSGARRPTFVRSDLVIPEVKARQIRGFMGLVIAREPNVSRMLGDAENPAHTEWSKHSSNFNYRYPDKHLNYVKHAAANVCQVLDDPQDAIAEDALAEFFSVTIPEEGPRPAPSRRPGDTTPTPVVPPRTSTPRPFSITRIDGGCVVRSTETPLPRETCLQILMAYDTRRGDPVKRYDPADFDLVRLNVVTQGLRILERHRNRLLVVPTDPAFSVRITGFDRRRDLLVRTNEIQVPL